MKSLRVGLLIFLQMISSGCSHYSDITGKVLDAVTGKPIEGAIVVVQWTNKRGWLGEQQRELHKIIETLTDKEGKFSLNGTTGFLLDPPEMLIYKDGYIPWRNDSIFPSLNLVKNHEWNDKATYKLDEFTNKYTYVQLYSFLDYGMMGNRRNEVPITSNLMRKISMEEQAEIENKMQRNTNTKP